MTLHLIDLIKFFGKLESIYYNEFFGYRNFLIENLQMLEMSNESK